MRRFTAIPGRGIFANARDSQLKQLVRAFESAGNDKADVSTALSELLTYLNSNVDTYETGISRDNMDIKYLFKITDDKVWYRNSAGTLYMLAPNGYWLKFNKAGGVTFGTKLSQVDRHRIQDMLER